MGGSEMGSSGDPGRFRRWESWEDAYGLTLALLLLTLLLPIFVEASRRLTAATGVTSLVACLIALHSSKVRPFVFWIAVGAFGVAVAAAVLDLVTDRDGYGVLAVCVGAVLLLTPPAILVRIARHRVITPRTLYGALSVY